MTRENSPREQPQMVADWAKGYVTEIDYTRGFYKELAPAHLAFAAHLRAVRAPDISRPFRYFEVGCGQGVSTNVFAAAYPHAQFYGNDFNPAHIRHARALAQAARLGNLTFLEASFAELPQLDLPEFDFIVLHGIYSWIDAADRGHIVDFIGRRLRPGGLVYVSYNCHPGFTQMLPIRRLMVEHAAGQRGPIADRIRAARAFVERLKGANPAYFASAQGLMANLEALQRADPVYLAHEYFGAHWDVMHVADVAAEMGRAKASFVGSATLLDAFEQYVVGADRLKLLQEQTDPMLREMLKDLMTNQGFRRDIYARGVARLLASQQSAALRATTLALAVARGKVLLKHAIPGGELTLDAQTCEPLLDALAQSPKTMGELAELTGRREPARAMELLSCASTLAAFNQLVAAPPDAEALDRSAAVARLNAALFERTQEGEPLHVLASPVLGAAIGANQLEQLLLRAAELDGTASADRMQALLDGYGVKYQPDGLAAPATPEAAFAALGVAVAEFNAQRLPYLRLMQVSTGASGARAA